MTQAQFNLAQYNKAFFTRYSTLFKNRAPAVPNLSDYFVACNYHAEKGPFLVGASNFGVYHPDILLKLEPYFLYSFPDTTGKLGFTFVFNFGDNLHAWIYVYNLENVNSLEPKFVALPAVYGLEPEIILKFYDDNQEFLIKPTQPTKTAGFGGLVAPSASEEINWLEKIAKKD